MNWSYQPVNFSGGHFLYLLQNAQIQNVLNIMKEFKAVHDNFKL